MHLLVSSLVLILFSDPGANLLANADFEEADLEGNPIRWSLFLVPSEGVRAGLDDGGLDGSRSAKIHISSPYDEDPATNWSQVVVREVGGKRLRVSGQVRVDDASEAAIWLQCFSRNPMRVVAAGTSSTEWPVYGNRDWSEVTVELEAPVETDFLVVRCVLLGSGTAWFDGVELVVVDEEAEELDLEVFEPSDEVVAKRSSRISRREAREILRVNEEIQESIRALTASNAELLDRIYRIQGDLGAYRNRLGEDEQGLELEPLSEGYDIHPLVPHGYGVGGNN